MISIVCNNLFEEVKISVGFVFFNWYQEYEHALFKYLFFAIPHHESK